MQTKPVWQSKTVWAAVIGVIIPILNQAFGWNMNVEEVLTMVLPLIAYILGEKYKDSKVQAETINQQGSLEYAKVAYAPKEAPKE